MSLSLQDLLDIQGFIVIAYTEAEELEADDARGAMNTSTCTGSLNNLKPDPPIIGHATVEEFIAQDKLTGDTDPRQYQGYVGFRKVIFE